MFSAVLVASLSTIGTVSSSIAFGLETASCSSILNDTLFSIGSVGVTTAGTDVSRGRVAV